MSSKSVVRLERGGPPGVGLSFLGHCESENVVAGTPTETGHNYFTNATGQLTSGVWECTAYTAEFEGYPADEFCCVLEGTVSIIEAGGREETFGPGECFVIPKGLPCTWHMPGTLRKFYVIFDADGKAPGA